MQIYLVGGAVRDRLLGLPVQDRDHVVVGATADDMLALGFTPVGKDFPVFLHPQSHEEHALARTERKTAPGYRGFVFHADAGVTLEQDLQRRDLTINAMAEGADGVLVDPYGGRADLQARVLRHVAPAFAEDPVRILRVARFSARFADFTLAPETALLMRSMVERGEVDALVPERVWQEFSRGLMERTPSRMLLVLHACGALARLMPEVDALWRAGGSEAQAAVAAMSSLDAVAGAGAALPERLAVLLQAVATPSVGSASQSLDTAAIDAICMRLKIPGESRDLAVAAGRERERIRGGPAEPAQAIALLERCDAFRKPERFHRLLDALGFLGWGRAGDIVLIAWRGVLAAAQAVDTGAIARAAMDAHPGQPQRINQAVRAARTAAVTEFLAAGTA